MRLKIIDGHLVKDSDFEDAAFPDDDMPGTVRLRRISRDEHILRENIEAREAREALRAARAAQVQRIRDEAEANSRLLAERIKYFREVNAAQQVVDMKRAVNAARAEDMLDMYVRPIYSQNNGFRVDKIDDYSDYANRRAQEDAALDVPLSQLVAEYEAMSQVPVERSQEQRILMAETVISPNSAAPSSVPVAIVAPSPRAASFNPTNPLLALTANTEISATDIFAALKSFFTVRG